MRVLLVLAILVAGCTQTPPDAPSVEPGADFSDLGLEATQETGVVRGVVVDAEIRPLAGASVTLNATVVETDPQGRFGFSKVPPGLHPLSVSKAGYATQEHVVEAVANVAEPAIVKVVLRRIPGTEPHILPLEWTGHIDCSLNAAGVFFDNCGIPAQAGVGGDARRYDVIAVPPTFIQSELHWRPTQSLGDNLCMRHYASDDGTPVGRVEPDACGGSPQVQRIDGAFIEAEGIGNTSHLERVVWVAQRPDIPSGLATDQDFAVFTFLFYNMEPDDGWVFVRDGEHPVPSVP